jgi:NAD(P) transhydrogenase
MTYDLVVIGSGPAGEKGAAQAAYFGKKVALIEKEPVLGGAAANTGTLPSKTLRETALFLSGFRHRELEGLDFRGLKKQVTIRDFMARERLIVERERNRIQHNLDRHNVTLYRGTASFVDGHTLSVQPKDGPAYEVRGEIILIATGSHPYRPPKFSFIDSHIRDSDTILSLHEIPSTMLVVGGGVIGCEYACMFAEIGIQVTLVEKRHRLLEGLDREIVDALQKRMESIGVHVVLCDDVAEVGLGSTPIQVRLVSGAVLAVDKILVSSGRSGNTEALALERAGITTDARGRIPVNEHYQTCVPTIYAAGDVIGNPALASTSMDQARVAMVHAFDLKYRKGLGLLLPYGIYTIPECSMAGDTEEALQEKKIPYVVGRASYVNNARGQIIGDKAGFLKLIFGLEDMKLLGVHVLGEQATELVHVGLTALLLGVGAELFITTCYNYPTLSELYKYATYDALGQQDKLKGHPSPIKE